MEKPYEQKWINCHERFQWQSSNNRENQTRNPQQWWSFIWRQTDWWQMWTIRFQQYHSRYIIYMSRLAKMSIKIWITLIDNVNFTSWSFERSSHRTNHARPYDISGQVDHEVKECKGMAKDQISQDYGLVPAFYLCPTFHSFRISLSRPRFSISFIL